MNLEIRKYRSEEIPAILTLLVRCFPDDWAPLVMAGHHELAYRSQSIIALMNDKIIGNCGVIETPIRYQGQTNIVAGIGSVAVDPDFRGMGIAKKMLQAGLKGMKRSGIGLSPLFTDKPAVYEPLGWQVCPLNPALQLTGELTVSTDNWKIVQGRPPMELLTSLMKVYRLGWEFDGKVIRDQEYWMRRVLFNAGINTHWILHFNHDQLISYGLLDRQPDGTYFLSEAYALPRKEDDWRNLLGMALKFGNGHMIVALPSNHPLMTVINTSALTVTLGCDIYGEVLMLNDLNYCGISSSFYWPYADKF